jgi:hypothetical protein
LVIVGVSIWRSAASSSGTDSLSGIGPPPSRWFVVR